MALVYPRYVHGADGAHLLVHNEAEKDAALENGYELTPILTDAQKAAVKAAQIAAGELPAEDVVVEDVAATGKKKKKVAE
jgi:hypothetical protein